MDLGLFPILHENDLKLPYYMTSVGEWTHQEPVERKNGFQDYQWIQCIAGEGELRVDGAKHRVTPGKGMLLYAGVPHLYRPLVRPWSVRWVSFNGAQVPSSLAAFGLERSMVLALSSPEPVLQTMRESMTYMDANHPMGTLECSSLVYHLLIDLYRYGSGSEIRSKQHDYEQLTPVFRFIEAHYAEALSLEKLAKQLGVSSQHTCYLFQKTLGVRPFQYLTQYRIRKAKELLLEHMELDVQAVARRVGYEHPSYFIKLFRQTEGVTPSVFRTIHRSGPVGTAGGHRRG